MDVMQQAVRYRHLTAEDHSVLYELWQSTPGLTLRKADTLEGFTAYLKRNPGFSFAAEVNGKIIGGILGGHDGRFGAIHHLVVLPEYRSQGVGKRLVELSLVQIRAAGLEKCHIYINRDNPDGLKFWEENGWLRRDDLIMASYVFNGN